MVTLMIIALCCGAFSVLFIISELNETWNNINRVVNENRGFGVITLIWKVPIACKPVLFDVAITLGIVWLFSMGGGLIGMSVSLMASGLVSAFLYIKRRKV